MKRFFFEPIRIDFTAAMFCAVLRLSLAVDGQRRTKDGRVSLLVVLSRQILQLFGGSRRGNLVFEFDNGHKPHTH